METQRIYEHYCRRLGIKIEEQSGFVYRQTGENNCIAGSRAYISHCACLSKIHSWLLGIPKHYLHRPRTHHQPGAQVK